MGTEKQKEGKKRMRRNQNRLLIGLLLGSLFLMEGTLSIAHAAEGLVVDLEEGIRLAMEKNERLLMAGKDREKAGQQVREARADGLPQLDFSLNYNRNWMLPSLVFAGQTVKIGNNNNITGTLSLRQPLYSGGKVRAALASARNFREYAGEVERGVRQQVVEQVATAYYDLLLAKRLVQVSQLALDLARTNLAQAQALKRAGRVSDYDLLRAEVQVSSLKADSIRVANGQKLAEMVYKDIIGLDLQQDIEVVEDFDEEAGPPAGDLQKLVAVGMGRRPELRQLERRLQVQERVVQIEKAASRPSIDLVASGQAQFQSDKFDVADREWRKNWSSGVVVQFPLFDGLRTRARVGQARSDLRRAELERDRLEREIRLEITRAWLDCQDALERQKAQEAAVSQAEKGLQVAESRYASGAGTQLEILDAQLTLVGARTEWATASRDRALGLTRLELAVGLLGEER